MTHALLKFAHIVGAILIGGGLIAVWLLDLRTRQVREIIPFAEAARNIAMFYDGIVVPGALLLLASGTWLIVEFYGGWEFLRVPWLAGMVGLFLFEFIEGNTITRLYFMRLRRLSAQALRAGRITSELERIRTEHVSTFTHFLDLPLLLLIVALGVLKPQEWTMFFAGAAAALAIAAVLTAYVPRLYRRTD